MRRDDQISRIIDLKRQISRALHGATPEPLSRLDLTVAQMRIPLSLGAPKERRRWDKLPSVSVSPSRVRPGRSTGLCVRSWSNASDTRPTGASRSTDWRPAGQGLLDQLQQGRRARLEAALRLLDPAILDQVEEAFRLLRDALDEGAAGTSTVAAAPHEGPGAPRAAIHAD